MKIVFKNMTTNRSTTDSTVALYWIKAGYRVISVVEEV